MYYLTQSIANVISADSVRLKVSVVGSVGGTILTYLLGGIDVLLNGLFFFMLVDILTGVMAGAKDYGLVSAKFTLRKKLCTLIGISVATRIGIMYGPEGVHIRAFTIWFYIFMEAISISENLDTLGAPLPAPLKQLINKAKRELTHKEV